MIKEITAASQAFVQASALHSRCRSRIEKLVAALTEETIKERDLEIQKKKARKEFVALLKEQ